MSLLNPAGIAKADRIKGGMRRTEAWRTNGKRMVAQLCKERMTVGGKRAVELEEPKPQARDEE